MKLPHVTIEYREEESCAVGKMSAELIVGFGIHWAWMYLCMYNGHDLFQTGDVTYANVPFVTSATVLACTLLVYAACLKRARTIFATAQHRRHNRAIGAVCMFIGMLALVFVSGTDALNTALGVVSGVLTGFGSAILLMSFSVSFSVLDVATSSICVALALVVASGIYAVVTILQNIAPPAGMVFCMALPFAELLCLNRCSHQLVDNLAFNTLTIPVRSTSFGLRLGFPFLIMGFAMGFVCGEAFNAGGSLASTSDFAMSILLAGVFACALTTAAMLAQRKTSYYVFRTLLPIVAISLGLSVTPLGQDVAFSVFSLMSSYVLLETCVWVTLADISQRFRISAFTVFGVGRGTLVLGMLIALLADNPFPANPLIEGTPSLPLILILILLLTARSLIPTNTELRSTLAYGGTCPAFFDRDNLTDLNVEKIGIAVTGEISPKDTPDPADQTDTDAYTKDVAHKKTTVANEALQDDNPLAPERLGRFKRKCLSIADTYLLSRKETEVLFLLAKGHNSSAIQKSLYISEGTTNTHMRNIYRKLDVHSQQELIAMVESVEDDSWATGPS